MYTVLLCYYYYMPYFLVYPSDSPYTFHAPISVFRDFLSSNIVLIEILCIYRGPTCDIL